MEKKILKFGEYINEKYSNIQEPRDLVSEYEDDIKEYVFLYKTDELPEIELNDISSDIFLEYVEFSEIEKVLPYTNKTIFMNDIDLSFYEGEGLYIIGFLSEYYIFGTKELVKEDGVASATAAVAGMGAVVTPVASAIPGQTIGGSNVGDSFGSGGMIGSGDIGVPFNSNIRKRPVRSRRKQKAIGAMKMFKGYKNLIESVNSDIEHLFPFLEKMNFEDDTYVLKNETQNMTLKFWNNEEKWNIKFFCNTIEDNTEKDFTINDKNISFQDLKNCLTKINNKFFNNINESKKEKLITGSYVNKHIKRITPDVEDLPTYYMETLVKNRNFKIEKLKIDDILENDIDIKEYYIGGEQRYDDDEVNQNDLYEYIVIVDDVVVDGYNRLSTLKRLGEEYIEAYVAI